MGIINKNRFVLETIIYIVSMVGIIFSLMIYTSLYDVPWNTPEGFQFLHIIFTTPIIFGVIGILNLLINREDQGIIGVLNKLHPLLVVIGLNLPIIIDGSLSKLTTMTGSALCFGFIITNTLLYLNDFKAIRKLKF